MLAGGFIDANAKDSFPFGNESFASLFEIGGDKRDRTANLLNAIQALSQLSYTPIFTFTQMRFRSRTQVRVLLYHISQACQPLKFIFFLCYNIIIFGA